VRVQTNDPKLPWFELVLSGRVEKFAELRPERLRLAGPAGQPLAGEVEIIPRPGQPFTLGRVTAKSGNFIRFEVACGEGEARCLIRVENTRETPGKYADVLQVETGNPHKPLLAIPVIGVVE
jgi:hypothetical protein